jgi:predicted transcriptional regulator
MTPLRDKDRIVLTCINDGKDDVQKITEATTLENHHVTYAFDKLEDHGLIQVEKPDGMVERKINGQKRVFQHPKQAELTEKGRDQLEQEDTDLGEYENLTHRELVEKVHELENQIHGLERQLKMFRKQVQQQLE